MIGALALLCSVAATWISVRDEFSITAYALWLLALPLAVVAALHHDRVDPGAWRSLAARARRPAVALELMALAGVTAVAFVLRAYDLAHFPPAMHGDEGEMGMLALRVLDRKEPLAPFGTYFLDHPSLFHYILGDPEPMLLFWILIGSLSIIAPRPARLPA